MAGYGDVLVVKMVFHLWIVRMVSEMSPVKAVALFERMDTEQN